MRIDTAHVRLAAFALLLGASFLAACSSSGGDADAGTIAVADLPCSTNAECADRNFVCDPLRRLCVCTSDAMCAGNPAGAYCNAFTGRCVGDVAGCKSDGDCADGQFCDAALRTCRTRKGWCEPCSQDAECGASGDFCIHHPDFASAPTFCAAACGAGGTCPEGRKCAQTEKGQQCVPATGRCQQVSACNPDSGQRCAVDTDCTEGVGQACDRVRSRCVAAQATCVAGQACDPISRQCVAACQQDRECVERFADNAYVCVDGTCVHAETCRSDTECAADKWCEIAAGATSGVCQPACTADAECPLGQRCLAENGHRRCTPGCSGDSDCPLNAVCSGGVCEYATPTGARRCQLTNVCAPKEICGSNASDASRYHVCNATETCRACTGGCGAGVCAQIYTPSGSISRCAFRCATDDECPSGFSCNQMAYGPGANDVAWLCWPVDPNVCR